MSLSESTEMYLETVYLIQRENGHAHVVEIANQLGITKPSVTKAMNQLKEEGLIQKEAYGHITLTPTGEKMSQDIVKRHDLLTRFLEHSLNLDHREATDNACKMEHIISTGMMKAIKSYLEKKDGR